MSDYDFDVVIVGAGISGAIMAKYCLEKGHSVLILEAAAKDGEKADTYRGYVDTYQLNPIKTPNAPYPNNPNAPSPEVIDVADVSGTTPDTNGYFVQNGPAPFRSNYTRVTGGTMMHWLGTLLRMQPSDFQTKTLFDKGVDWPIGYDDLQKYYERAEWEIGTAGDKETNSFNGIEFREEYDFPMEPIPMSWSDNFFAKGVEGMTFTLDNGEEKTPRVVATPQGRNSTPRAGAYTVGDEANCSYVVGGATRRYAFAGQRCEGNSACVPICPIQAKYNPLRTLQDARRNADRSGARFELRPQCVVSEIRTDEGGKVREIVYKKYAFPGDPTYDIQTVKAKAYVLATNAVENAKLALASGLCPGSQHLGRNLMDHPYTMFWGRAPKRVGPFRGPGSTASLPFMRDGAFRKDKAAVRLELANWGWNFAANAPYSDVQKMVEQENRFGGDLRAAMFDEVQHQVRIGIMPEQTPSQLNRVTINPAYRDMMGEPRPVLDYDVDDYSRAGILQAIDLCQQIFQRMGIENKTSYDPNDPGYLTLGGRGFVYFGAGHNAGTHRIGHSREDGVTNVEGKTFDHDNLWMIGTGAMPTIATSNPTLTMTALVLMATESVNRALEGKA